MDEPSTTPSATKPRKTIPDKELDTVVNYVVVGFDWGMNYILPYKEGMAVMAALEHAERVKKYYAHEKLQFVDEKVEFNISIISQKEYREQKMKKLLGVDDEKPTEST